MKGDYLMQNGKRFFGMFLFIFCITFSSCSTQPGNGSSSSSVSSAPPKVNAPLISPAAGYYPAVPLQVSITDTTTGAVISWTTNSGAKWEKTNALTISDEQVVLTAKATKSGMSDSASVTATFYLLTNLQDSYSSDLTIIVTNYLNMPTTATTNQMMISNGVYSNVITNSMVSNFNLITNQSYLTNVSTNSVAICTTTNIYSSITNQYGITNFTLSTLPILTIKPSLMIKLLGKGINLGNTLDATPDEGDWTGGVRSTGLLLRLLYRCRGSIPFVFR